MFESTWAHLSRPFATLYYARPRYLRRRRSTTTPAKQPMIMGTAVEGSGAGVPMLKRMKSDPCPLVARLLDASVNWILPTFCRPPSTRTPPWPLFAPGPMQTVAAEHQNPSLATVCIGPGVVHKEAL